MAGLTLTTQCRSGESDRNVAAGAVLAFVQLRAWCICENAGT
jgi:hypothetical protein